MRRAVRCGRPHADGRCAADLPRVSCPPDRSGAASRPKSGATTSRLHYWDGFDFADTLFLARADTSGMFETYRAVRALVLSDRPADPAPMDSLMRRAAVSRPMLDYFSMLADGVLHDPNSPLRNDEFYIPVLRAQLAAPWYDEYERIAPEYDLEDGDAEPCRAACQRFPLYARFGSREERSTALEAEYVLLFVNNPGCPMCRRLREEIASSPMLSEMIERGRLSVLALYPDEDLAGVARVPRADAGARGSTPTTAGCVDPRARASTTSTPFRRSTCFDRRQARAGEGFDGRARDRGGDRPQGIASAADSGRGASGPGREIRAAATGIGSPYRAIKKADRFCASTSRRIVTFAVHNTRYTQIVTHKHSDDYGKEMALYRMRVHSRRSGGTRAVPDVQGRQGEIRRSGGAGGRPRLRDRPASHRRRQGRQQGAVGRICRTTSWASAPRWACTWR